MAVYAEYGWPPFISMALFAGFKPKKTPKADDVYGPEDLANFLSQYPGGERVAPPPEET